jgi:hypothetical protein
MRALACALFAALPLFAQHIDFARVFPPEEKQRAELRDERLHRAGG